MPFEFTQFLISHSAQCENFINYRSDDFEFIGSVVNYYLRKIPLYSSLIKFGVARNSKFYK
ncbi:MAG: hypothetical protein A2066_13470 [Bacteroidetes bacterium GWB2_41_8]|nr:MAG: hypothetical protein A2066_13470 [Bacteroidetes bacterium GWB2_41_8]